MSLVSFVYAALPPGLSGLVSVFDRPTIKPGKEITTKGTQGKYTYIPRFPGDEKYSVKANTELTVKNLVFGSYDQTGTFRFDLARLPHYQVSGTFTENMPNGKEYTGDLYLPKHVVDQHFKES